MTQDNMDAQRARCVKVRMTPVVMVFILANVGIWGLEAYGVFSPSQVFALHPADFMQGHAWQLFTYMFLHGGVLHLALNMLVLFMMGPETEREMGRRQFIIMYLLSGVLAGLGWIIISGGDSGTYCVGASGALFGVIGAFAALSPQRELTLLLLFLFEVPMKARTLALALGGLEILFLVYEPFGGGVANAAHLGGGVAGYVYVSLMIRLNPGATTPAGAIACRRRRLGSRAGESEELDRILEKMEKDGLKSLSPDERDVLRKGRGRGLN